MSVKIKIVHGVHWNVDALAGRGPLILDQLFFEADVAAEYAKRQVDTKKNLGNWELKPLTVARSIEEVDEYRRDQLRRSGLAKLTPEECEALGLTS